MSICFLTGGFIHLLKSFFIKPRPKNRESCWVFGPIFSPQGPVIIAQGIGGQHDGQLQFDSFLQVAGSYDKLKYKKRTNYCLLKLFHALVLFANTVL